MLVALGLLCAVLCVLISHVLHSDLTPTIVIISPPQHPPKGLVEDVDVYLAALDHATTDRVTMPTTTIVIHLETIDTDAIVSHSSAQHWLMFNPEVPQSFALWSKLTLVLTKTRQASSLARRVAREGSHTPVVFVSHTSRDRRAGPGEIAAGHEELTCAHIAGDSIMKNTELVLRTFAANPDLPPLTIVHRDTTRTKLGLPTIRELYINLGSPKHITLLSEFLPTPDLDAIAQNNACHVIPSYAEGFGHTANAARSVGALPLVPSIPPLNDTVPSELWIDAVSHAAAWKHEGDSLEVETAIVTEEALARAVRRIQGWSREQRRAIGQNVRDRFEMDRQFFLRSLRDLVDTMTMTR